MRITGGTYRSRALKAPSGHATRPTTDRVREALFGILVSAGGLDGARVLDLYAGTGALALEAISRGAGQAVLVESGREALNVLRANIAALGLEDRARVVAGDVAQAIRRLGWASASAPSASPPPFDLVFADPPWALIEAPLGRAHPAAVLAELACEGGLAAEATVVLEHSSRTIPLDVEGLLRLDTRRYGDTALTFYKPAILGPLRQ